MEVESLPQVLIVEGKQDRKKIEKVLANKEEIICTYGTLSAFALDELIDEFMLFDRDVFIFTDTDDPGKQLRKLLNQELSHAENLFIDPKYRQVEDTPEHVLASILQSANFNVKIDYLKGSERDARN
ncbi:toprim domain-containing protein [Alkalibacillus haloalkaliphilus]|uniref:toprim domain-containing protein n=1 Tax=Alkalibacillus haloalkaliphilus TaxID=94136 RepID=UPI0002DE0D63|nr:toprim domain-containing protein [Alkalibacillus haloalkaliphilus]